MKGRTFLIITLVILTVFSVYATHIRYASNYNGEVEFISKAPQEIIKAKSNKLSGIVDWEKGVFFFSIQINTFLGFNNPLQREHFNENYMESHIYPNATFKGKIIEDINLQNNTTYSVRAKGKLEIHGISKETIIDVILNVSENKVMAQSEFKIMLSDYDIKIPRIVSEKLSPEILVNVNVALEWN